MRFKTSFVQRLSLSWYLVRKCNGEQVGDYLPLPCHSSSSEKSQLREDFAYHLVPYESIQGDHFDSDKALYPGYGYEIMGGSATCTRLLVCAHFPERFILDRRMDDSYPRRMDEPLRTSFISIGMYLMHTPVMSTPDVTPVTHTHDVHAKVVCLTKMHTYDSYLNDGMRNTTSIQLLFVSQLKTEEH